jgi:hypothetical protein
VLLGLQWETLVSTCLSSHFANIFIVRVPGGPTSTNTKSGYL